MTFSQKLSEIGALIVKEPMDRGKIADALSELEHIHMNEIAPAGQSDIKTESTTLEIMKAMNADLERVLYPDRSRS